MNAGIERKQEGIFNLKTEETIDLRRGRRFTLVSLTGEETGDELDEL